MKNTELKIPALRFPEFSGEWEETRLGEVSESFSGGTPSVGNKTFYGGEIPFIKSGEIRLSKTADYITEEGLNNSSARLVNKGDILYALYGATSGEVGISKIDGAINQAVLCIRSSLNHYFLFSQLNHYKTQITHTFLQGGQGNLSGQIVKELKVYFPSLPEQQKIADFLSAVDKRLQLLKDKKTKLEEYKRGVMQRIFSQELRFTRPDGSAYPDWEEKRLGEMGFFTSGTGFSEKEQGGVSGIPFYKVSDMNMPENIQIMQKANNYVSDKQIIDNRYKVIKKPSIIFAKVGAAIFLERKRVANNFLIDNNMMSFTPAGNIMFFFQLFQTIHLSKFAQVGALPSYNASDVSSIRIIIPTSEDEQRQIADFLSAIDDKISLLNQQIASTEQYKKGLLQQMFV